MSSGRAAAASRPGGFRAVVQAPPAARAGPVCLQLLLIRQGSGDEQHARPHPGARMPPGPFHWPVLLRPADVMRDHGVAGHIGLAEPARRIQAEHVDPAPDSREPLRQPGGTGRALHDPPP
jgi:hypothetical protein